MTTLSLQPAPRLGRALAPGARVAICLITCRRPESLARLLAALAWQAQEPGAPQDVLLVVVDNDPEGSAGPVVEAARVRLPWEVVYALEPRRGIPAARNTSVTLASGADALVFIDDDEEPAPGWLRALLDTQRVYEADVVSGRVDPRFEARPPRWVTRGRFFELQRHRTGTVLPSASTNNTLVLGDVFLARLEPFDETMASTGGSDTRFFNDCVREGRLIVHANEALVFECLPASRVSARWLVQRAMRHSIAHAWTAIAAKPERAIAPRLYLAAKGLYWVLRGLLVLPGAIPRRPDRAVRASCLIARGVGVGMGLAGMHYEEYRRVHGS